MRLAALLLGLMLAALPESLCCAGDPAPQPATSWEPGAADASAFDLLASARRSLDLIRAGEQQDREILFATALASLTALSELHGCAWADAPLAELYGLEECPDLHIGHSSDGRLSLRLQRLELFNPAFDASTVYLATLEGNTSLTLDAATAGPLILSLTDGTTLTAERVDMAHPLWVQLSRIAPTFEPPAWIVPGAAISFKQIYSLPSIPRQRIASATLKWGEYDLRVRYRENSHLPPLSADIL